MAQSRCSLPSGKALDLHGQYHCTAVANYLIIVCAENVSKTMVFILFINFYFYNQVLKFSRDPSESSWRVAAGQASPNSTNVTSRSIAQFVRQLRYKLKGALADHDLMLVKLDQPLNLGQHENQPYSDAICLPSSRPLPDDYCVTAGWGFTSAGGYEINTRLKHLRMKIVDSKKCNSSQHYNGKLTEMMICAEGEGENGATPCSVRSSLVISIRSFVRVALIFRLSPIAMKQVHIPCCRGT